MSACGQVHPALDWGKAGMKSINGAVGVWIAANRKENHKGTGKRKSKAIEKKEEIEREKERNRKNE